jgi:23S rRNA (cytidine1920-2'-O)/16S rRNA (cytidine1409-2'-O)-methyltransferase
MSRQRDKLRADDLLVRQGSAETRSKARALILAGDVRVGDRLIDKPAALLDPSTTLEVRAPPPYVSRGGLKLQHALDEFGVNASGLVAADIGASTGGFTDCLLQRGALRVYAIDVGYGQLDYRLRADERVVVMERVNARYLDKLPEQPALVVIDVSFISLELILPVAAALSAADARVIALIKPQFEAGRDAVGRGGVVRDERVRRQAVEHVIASASANELRFGGLTRSPILGPAGNAEFLALLGKQLDALDSSHALQRVFSDP